MALSHEVFTEAQLNGPKNVMGYPEKSKSVFEIVSPKAAPEIITLLRLAEREGAYARLTPRRKEILQKYYVEGQSMPQIADGYGVSKQAISQSLRLTPESLFKQMTKDVSARRTPISFREVLATYADYRVYLDKKKKSRGKI
nr:hypothetical protein [Candidatus Levybacteria bacterium]